MIKTLSCKDFLIWSYMAVLNSIFKSKMYFAKETSLRDNENNSASDRSHKIVKTNRNSKSKTEMNRST